MTEESFTIIDHIRRRPGMYVGDLHFSGLRTMIGYFFDETLTKNKNRIDVTIEFKRNHWISIKIDNTDTSLFVKTIENLKAEKTYVSIGIPIIIALSERAEIKIVKDTKAFSLHSSKGQYEYSISASDQNSDSIEVDYQIDNSIFKDTTVNYEVINHFLRKYAYINTECRITSIDSTKQTIQKNIFEYPNGLSHKLDYKIAIQLYARSFFRLDLNTKIEDYEYQICISYQNSWLKETIITTYANYDELIYGGSLEKGIIDGLNNAIKQTAKTENIEIENRKIREQLIIFAVIKGDNFDFSGSTKTELQMPKVRKDIKNYISKNVIAYLADNETIKNKLLNHLMKEY